MPPLKRRNTSIMGPSKRRRPSARSKLRGETKAHDTTVSTTATRAGTVTDLEPSAGTGVGGVIGNKYHLLGMTAHLNIKDNSSNADWVRIVVAVVNQASVSDASGILTNSGSATAPFGVYQADAFGDFTVLADAILPNEATSTVGPLLLGDGFYISSPDTTAEGDFLRMHWSGKKLINLSKQSVVLLCVSEQSASHPSVTGTVQIRYKDA